LLRSTSRGKSVRIPGEAKVSGVSWRHAELVSLPLYPSLAPEAVEEVAAAVRAGA